MYNKPIFKMFNTSENLDFIVKTSALFNTEDFRIEPVTLPMLRKLKVRQEQNTFQTVSMQDYYYHVKDHAKFIFLLTYKDEPLMLVNLLELWPNVGECTMLVSEKITDIPRPALISMVKCLKSMIELSDYTRIQATIKKGFKIAQRFVEAFGFKKEGLLRKYTFLSEDYYMYAYIKEDDE